MEPEGALPSSQKFPDDYILSEITLVHKPNHISLRTVLTESSLHSLVFEVDISFRVFRSKFYKQFLFLPSVQHTSASHSD